MRNTIAKRLAAVATVSALVLTVPGTAFAQTQPLDPATVETDRAGAIDQTKRRALEAIDKRLDAVAGWTQRVAESEHLDAGHRATLVAELEATTRGLTALATDIEAATTLSELGALVPKIVEDYWVFALLGPKVHLVIAADAMAHIGGRLEEVSSTIQAAIDRLEEAEYDPAEAQAALDRMTAHLGVAASLIDPVPATVLGLKPADMPEASDQLRNARAELESAGEELRAAGQAGREAVEAIRKAITP